MLRRLKELAKEWAPLGAFLVVLMSAISFTSFAINKYHGLSNEVLRLDSELKAVKDMAESSKKALDELQKDLLSLSHKFCLSRGGTPDLGNSTCTLPDGTSFRLKIPSGS